MKFGVSSAGARGDVGTMDLHVQAERLVAKFLGSPILLSLVSEFG